MTVPAVVLDGVARTYPGTPPVDALLPADLSILPGDYLAITGPSGSGKSTLLNVLGLLDRPSSGRLWLSGEDVSGLAEGERTAVRGRSIGFVFQFFHLVGHRTATENVELSMLYSGVPRRLRAAEAGEALARVGLSHRRDALPNTMSGGERQRVAIARAIVTRPLLLLADEPTGNLDSGNAGRILDIFDELHADGHTLVIVTHNPEVAVRADRQAEIRDGVLREVAA